ncbi:MNIO family bufferin maturase [Streptomyces mirabilis]
MTAPDPGEDLGFGIGVRPVLFAELLECDSGFDFFELMTEDFLGVRGERRHILHELATRSPVVLHGLSMSIASSDALDVRYLSRLRELADEIGARWVSDHLCWTGVDGVHTHELLPVPLTESSLTHVRSRVLVAQDVLERPLVLENPSAYLAFEESTMSEPEFFSRLVEETGCRILLDVNNIYVSASNLGFDPVEYVDALPEGSVAQIHLAGHRNMGTYLIDSHDERVSQPVWDVYLHACRRFGPVSTSLEWDTHLPKTDVLREELSKAAALRSEAGRLRPSPSASMVSAPPDGQLMDDVTTDPELAHSQRTLQAAILDGASQNRLPRRDVRDFSLRPLSRGEGISIYGSAYRARHVDSLRFAFPLLGELIGSELEDLALDYVAAHPGRTGDLECLTRLFAAWVTDAFRLHYWADVVRDVVDLDTTLRDLRLRTGTEGWVPLPASSIRFARHADAARMRFVANPCLRITRVSEPSYMRNLSIRAGTAIDWSGEASENVVFWRRDFELHAMFLGRDQGSLLKRLVDGVELGTAAVAESIDIPCSLDWISGWAGAGILFDEEAACPAADSTASDAEA